MRWKQKIRYWTKRKNKYHLHSPFVFGLVTEGLSASVDDKIKHDLESYRGEIISAFNNYKVSPPKKRPYILLAKLTNYFHPRKALCIGINMGMSMLAMQMADILCFCESDDAKAEIAMRLLSDYGVNPQRLTLEDVMHNIDSFEMIYVEHSCLDVSFMSSLLSLLRMRDSRYICILEGIHETSESETTWSVIKSLDAVNLTLDFYHLGMVFFCPGMEKQHFVLKA